MKCDSLSKQVCGISKGGKYKSWASKSVNIYVKPPTDEIGADKCLEI